MSIMKEPQGDGTAKVTKFEDYQKYKFDNPETMWIEDYPSIIFPDCVRDTHITEDKE